MPEKDYSHRDVLDKVGLKPGDAVRVVGGGDRALLTRVREKVGRAPVRAGLADVVLYWPRLAGEITRRLSELRGGLVESGGIWVFIAKREQRSASGMGYLYSCGPDPARSGRRAGRQQDLLGLGNRECHDVRDTQKGLPGLNYEAVIGLEVHAEAADAVQDVLRLRGG